MSPLLHNCLFKDSLTIWRNKVETEFKLETLLSKPSLPHTIKLLHSPQYGESIRPYTFPHRFTWNHWLLDMARLIFLKDNKVFPMDAAVLIASIITPAPFLRNLCARLQEVLSYFRSTTSTRPNHVLSRVLQADLGR